MKATAQQHREFQVISSFTNESESQIETTSRIRFGRRGLHSVDSSSDRGRRPGIFGLPKLTSVDVMRVNHATIREGESHRVWPPSVLQLFNQAEVITTSRIKHYELKDSSLIRV